MARHITYEKVKRGLSAVERKRVWPGCDGDGMHMPCGRVHDFGQLEYTYAAPGERKHIANVCCLQNHERGCPQPQPPRTEGLAEWAK